MPCREKVSFEEAAILEPVAVALHAFEFLQMLPGDTVVISGFGPIGLAHIRLAKAMGLRVLALEVIEERRTQAMKFGAEATFDPAEKNLSKQLEEKIPGRHFFVECAGASESLRACLSLIGRGGGLAMVGSSNTEVNLRSFLLKGLTFYGVRGGGGMYPRAIRLIETRWSPCPISFRYPTLWRSWRKH